MKIRGGLKIVIKELENRLSEYIDIINIDKILIKKVLI